MPVAAALRAAGLWSTSQPPDLDSDDWWYRCRFSAVDTVAPVRLRFEGLATVADVWLNGEHILHSENMFVAHDVDVPQLVAGQNELVLRFSALAPLLEPSRRPRPRWRTALVERQNLRWFRTSLLGRIPGWCPPIAPVGPWKPITIVTSAIDVERADVSARLDGDIGVLQVDLRVRHRPGPRATVMAGGVAGTIAVGDWRAPLTCEELPGNLFCFTATIRIPSPQRWWPHTHGPQPLYDVQAFLKGQIDETIDLGRIGFRTVDLNRASDGHGFGLVVNGTPIFCRGVCWTPLDIARLSAGPLEYRTALRLLADAGVNMIRVSGTMTYESEHFHDVCDELGLLVWQDLMFARMDYPWQDDVFRRSVATEVTQVVQDLQSRPSLAVICGNSEVDQQAAMLGLTPAHFSNAKGDAFLADIVRARSPHTVLVPTSPGGSFLPFHVDAGVSHYYGVGAYRRPFDDARRSGVRFASECLAFSNVPEPVSVLSTTRDRPIGEAAGWKEGVPADPGADWDFEDVRDHYVRQLFDVAADDIQHGKRERCLALGRVATGEAMLRTFAEWRRPGSTCRGGLVWFARDLSPGAGWGIIDASGRPKSVYWYLKRAWMPVTLVAIDEGLNGLWLHALNDTPAPVDAELRVALYLDGTMRGRPAHQTLRIPGGSSTSVHADAMFGAFLDLTRAYRFGAPGHDVVAATLRDPATATLLGSCYYFPGTLPATCSTDLGLTAHIEPMGSEYSLVLETRRFAHAVGIELDDFLPADNYVCVEPGEIRRVALTAIRPAASLRGRVSALNGSGTVPIVASEAAHVR
jgi:beta-mannosidase